MDEQVGFTGSGAEVMEAALRHELLQRKERLTGSAAAAHPEAIRLLLEVDAALGRLDRAAWGGCERCHETVEADRLRLNPLVRVCLGCLTEPETRALERDLELAASIQAALLPPARVRHDGWEVAFRYLPHGPVSGDHVDVLLPASEQQALHVALGDVSGKGVAAALLMSHLQAALRTLVRMGLPPSSATARANRLLADSTLASSYATMILARLEPTGRVELCNAGHPAPILVRGDTAEHLPGGDIPLGMLSDANYSDQTRQLHPGDLFFLFSDGLSETMRDGHRLLGREAIARTLLERRADDLDVVLDACVELATRFSGGAPRRDDLTLLAIRRVG